MRYAYFEVENFKGISKLRLDLESDPRSRIHTLVGLNESGKTTILEAIDYFTGTGEDLDPTELAGRIRPDPHDLIPAARRANFNGDITVRAGVALDEGDRERLEVALRRGHGYKLTSVSDSFTISDIYEFRDSKFNRSRTQWRGLEAVGRMKQERKDWAITDKPSHRRAVQTELRRLLPSIWYFPNFLFDFPRSILLETSEADSQEVKFYRALLQDMLDSLKMGTSVETHILDRARSDSIFDRRALDGLMRDLSRSVTDEVFRAWDRIFNREVSDKQVVFSVQQVDSRWAVVLQIEDTDGYFYLNERSLGFRWFFAFLLLTRYRGLRKAGESGVIFLLDEPASNLHSRAQGELLGSLERLAESCTIVYTTHSHHMINPSWLENTYVVRNLGIEPSAEDEFHAKKTDIALDRYRAFAGSHPDQAHYFQPILDKLDYQPSRLELVPDLVMVEGKTDFYLLKYFNDVLGIGDPLHMTPGRGAGTLDTLIRLYLGWGRNFVVLLDADSEGDRQKARYEETYGPLLEGRIFTLEDIDARYAKKELEDLLNRNDQLAIQQRAYPDATSFNKKQFSRAVQELLVSRDSIEVGVRTREKMFKVLTGLGSALRQNAVN